MLCICLRFYPIRGKRLSHLSGKSTFFAIFFLPAFFLRSVVLLLILDDVVNLLLVLGNHLVDAPLQVAFILALVEPIDDGH